MKKIILVISILSSVFLTSCNQDETDISEICTSKICAYELLSEIDLNGLAVGSIDPNVDYFTSERYYPTSIKDIKSSVGISLGLNQSQMNALIATLSGNIDLVYVLIENNKNTIESLLYFSDWRDRVSFWYQSIEYWRENFDSSLSTDFETFFEMYGYLDRFPHEWNDVYEDFYDDMNDIIESHPECIMADGRNGYVPEKYKSWLFLKRWQDRIGMNNINNIMNLAKDLL